MECSMTHQLSGIAQTQADLPAADDAHVRIPIEPSASVAARRRW